jgi:hypothetical protein
MLSFPLARTQSTSYFAPVRVTQRDPSQELQSPGLGRHQDPAAAPGLGPLVRLQAILAHELADWLGARSATKRARRLVRHPLRALCGSVRSHSSSTPIRRTRTSASTGSIAATHAGYCYALTAHCRPPFFFCQWVCRGHSHQQSTLIARPPAPLTSRVLLSGVICVFESQNNS